MKRLLVIAILFTAMNTSGQDEIAADTTKPWSIEGFGALNLNQVSFTNWAAGGDNSISFSVVGNLIANYHNNKHNWENRADLLFGIIRTDEMGVRKNDDRMELETKYGYELSNDKKWLAMGLANFKSQFANGYNYPNDSLVISRFAAPAYLTLSAGIEYKPFDYFSVFISPATGKLTFVRDQIIANAGTYGNEPAVLDPTGAVITEGERFRGEFGAYLNARFEKEVIKNILILSKVELFNNYTDKNKVNRKYVDVDWQTSFVFKINDWFSASLILHLIYDRDIDIPDQDDPTVTKKAVQFKQNLGLGVTYKFDNKGPGKKN